MNPDEWPDGYAYFPNLSINFGQHSLRPITWADRVPIRRWRNEQIEILRQREPLSVEDQDLYFERVIAAQMAMVRPPQLLFGYLEGRSLVGYGGFVHIDWGCHQAEVSFLTATARALGDSLRRDWKIYLDMVTVLARNVLDLDKLTTETFETRSNLPPILEDYGFQHEGVLVNRRYNHGQWYASVSHGLALK